ncbi:MAG: hypothetical protein K6348_01215 [Deferribacterales bacterium]
MEPTYCPYCGEDALEELDPTELVVDNQRWIIYHYECAVCNEVFDKIYIDDNVDELLIDNEEDDKEKLWS